MYYEFMNRIVIINNIFFVCYPTYCTIPPKRNVILLQVTFLFISQEIKLLWHYCRDMFGCNTALYDTDLIEMRIQQNHIRYYLSIHTVVRQSFNCEMLGITYTHSLLVGGEFTEDVVGVGRADPHLREGCKFLRHLIQQSPHLRHKHHSQVKRDHTVSGAESPARTISPELNGRLTSL